MTNPVETSLPAKSRHRSRRIVGLCTAVAFAAIPAFVADDATATGTPRPKYRVTITNLTEGQPFTPPVVATHGPGFRAFNVDRKASVPVLEIAENGNLAPALDAYGSHPAVVSTLVAGNGPLMPGASVSVEIVGGAAQHRRQLSIVGMLICTNDGFTGLTGRLLPREVGGTSHWYSFGYDAGTELNTEDFADIVPPCPALTGVPTSDAGTGQSNPALAERGVIHHHEGIDGSLETSDLDAEVHGWSIDRAVAVVSVERIR